MTIFIACIIIEKIRSIIFEKIFNRLPILNLLNDGLENIVTKYKTKH